MPRIVGEAKGHIDPISGRGDTVTASGPADDLEIRDLGAWLKILEQTGKCGGFGMPDR